MIDLKTIALAIAPALDKHIADSDEILAIKIQPRVARIRYRRYVGEPQSTVRSKPYIEADMQILYMADGSVRYDIHQAREPIDSF